MDCTRFKNWLENRDLSDISESDQAAKHTNACRDCQELEEKDALLDKAIAAELAAEPIPDHLEKVVALNLSSSVAGRGRSMPTGLVKVLSACGGLAALLLLFFLVPVSDEGRTEFSGALLTDHLKVEDFHPLEQVADVSQWVQDHTGQQASIPADLGAENMKLLGARICIISNCRTLHLIYQADQRRVSLYIVNADQAPAELVEGKTYNYSRQGKNIRMWREQNQVYVIVT